MVLRKLILSIRNEIALLISLVSTLPGKLDDLGLNAVACKITDFQLFNSRGDCRLDLLGLIYTQDSNN